MPPKVQWFLGNVIKMVVLIWTLLLESHRLSSYYSELGGVLLIPTDTNFPINIFTTIKARINTFSQLKRSTFWFRSLQHIYDISSNVAVLIIIQPFYCKIFCFLPGWFSCVPVLFGGKNRITVWFVFYIGGIFTKQLLWLWLHTGPWRRAIDML